MRRRTRQVTKREEMVVGEVVEVEVVAGNIFLLFDQEEKMTLKKIFFVKLVFLSL